MRALEPRRYRQQLKWPVSPQPQHAVGHEVAGHVDGAVEVRVAAQLTETGEHQGAEEGDRARDPSDRERPERSDGQQTGERAGAEADQG